VGWVNISTNANPENISNPAPNTIVFNTNGVFSTHQTITLLPSLGTLGLNDTTTPEAIDGPGVSVVTVSGGGQLQVLSVNSGVTATIAGLTIANGSGSFGGGVYNDGTLTVTNSTLSSNSATYGGGIYNVGTLTFTNSTVSSNSARITGGGIEDQYGNPETTDNTTQGFTMYFTRP